ncbi:phospholipase domain-containing protein, partial [Serratia rubidaea]
DALRQRQEQLPPVPLPAAGQQQLPQQKRQARPSRALPYQLQVEANVYPQQQLLALNMINSGSQGAVFHVYDRLRLDEIPRRFTVEAGKALSDEWQIAGDYDLWLLGPNGFHRALRGNLQHSQAEVRLERQPDGLRLTLLNPGAQAQEITLAHCPYGSREAQRIPLAAGATHTLSLDVSASGGWYDISLTDKRGWLRRLAGRLENGRHSISDPLMGQP